MGAYWLLHSLRRAVPKRSRWHGATFETIRRTFVKIAVRVEEPQGQDQARLPSAQTILVVMYSLGRSPRLKACAFQALSGSERDFIGWCSIGCVSIWY
jgi:hypothetical protein